MIYVGGCFDDYTEIRKIQNFVKSKGFEISYDWTIHAEKTIKTRNTKERSIKILQEESDLDINGVHKSDWSIFVINKENYVYRGTFCEIGASLMRDIMLKQKRTIIIESDDDTYAKSLCFYYHPNIIHVKTLEELEKIILY